MKTTPGTQVLKPRQYQIEALDAVENELASGVLRTAVVCPTGTGKTVIFSHLIARQLDKGLRVLVMVHREELAQQAAAKIRSVAPGVDVGIVKAELNEVDAQVVIASVQTLSRESRLTQIDPSTIGMVIVDECFPAGTLVGGRPIESLRPGDVVPSWDEKTGREGLRPVVRVTQKVPSALVRVTSVDGRAIVCTPNHPFLTERGWCPAARLHGESVISFHDGNHPPASDMSRVPGVCGIDRQAEDRLVATFRADVLHARASGRVGSAERIRAHGSHQSATCFDPDDCPQSDAQRGIASPNAGDVGSVWPQARGAGWERGDRANASARPGGSTQVADRGGCSPVRRSAPLPLPSGHRASVDDGVRRSGRGIPLLAGAPSLRPASGRSACATRVVDVEVLEPGRDGTYGGLCAGGVVYNLEVEGTHTYLIDGGTVVHNCHHAIANTWVEVLTYFGCFDCTCPDTGKDNWKTGHDPGCPVTDERPTPAVGFTATMYRDDGRGLGNVWESVAYEREIMWAVERGYLTDVRGQQVLIDDFDLAQIARSRGDYQEGKLGDALISINAGEVVARAYREHAVTDGVYRKGVLFAPTVDAAYHFAEAFSEAGIRSAVVEGTTSREDRTDIYRRYDNGELDVLHNCMVLTEGWDSPSTEVCVVARPTQNPALYTQMVGRVLRPSPGKLDALVLDVVGIAGRHALQSLTTLTKVQMLEGESITEAQERVVRERAEAGERETITQMHKLREVELFAASHSTWLQTKGGVRFIPVRIDSKSAHIILWENGAGTWNVGQKVTGRAGEWLHKGLTMEYAMAWGEEAANDIDPTLAEKERGWRRTKPSDKQLDLAVKLRLGPVEELSTYRKGAISDLLSVHFASRDLDKMLAK